MWMDRGLKRPPEDEQKRDRRDTNGQCSKPIHHALSAPRSSLGVSLFPITKGSIGQERRETCKQAEEKIQVGMVANSCSASALANLAVPKELRPAAGRLLVALDPLRVLFLCAKHLLIADSGLPVATGVRT